VRPPRLSPVSTALPEPSAAGLSWGDILSPILRQTATACFDATFTTTGRTFSWVGLKAASRDTADVYVDGVLVRHLSAFASSTTYRYVLYSGTFSSVGSHSIKVVYTGAPTKHIDVDAFIVLR
jgi:hypothetical protein